MNNIKDAISRVSRSMRMVEYMRDDKVALKWTKNGSTGASSSKETKENRIIRPHNTNLSKKELQKRKKHLNGYQRKVFQDFLKPVNIPNLKIFEPEPRPFDAELAKTNWKAKTNQNNVMRYNSFLENRVAFTKMLDLLVELTPAHLVESANDQDLSRKLSKNETHYKVPRYWFTEIPPMPQPLTPESFKDYVYFLTHSKVLYKNSLSLMSGLIPDILLYTHKATNTKYKLVRSTDTYNYLIKYFGFDKNQSSFARELLLVMKHDGHQINIDTINNLLKLCLIHANIRTTTNTHQIVIKYLRLSRELGIEINLKTWTRVYDLIKNIFFKEMFISKLATINLPILPSLGLRILEDFGETTKNTEDVITFIESDLRLKDWQSHARFSNKVLFHRAKHAAAHQLDEFFHKYCTNQSQGWDDHSPRYVLQGLQLNPNIEEKLLPMLAAYCRLVTANSEEAPEVFQKVLGVLLRNKEQYDYEQLSHIIRGVMHDATTKLALPREVVEYAYGNGKSESYKILRRMVGRQMNQFEGILQESVSNPIALHEPLSGPEIGVWHARKQQMCQIRFVNAEIETLLNLVKKPQSADGKKYQQIERGKINDMRARQRVRRLEMGLEAYVEQEMQDRKL